MMNPGNRSQKGQALVLIAFAIFGMIGLVGLAIDGGHAYADRRQAQNAADAGSLAAARRYAQDQTVSDDYLTGIARNKAGSNGYIIDPPRSNVALAITSAPSSECVNDPNGKYIQVDIDSTLPTWFSSVIGIKQVHNHVISRALSCPSVREPAYGGNALVATNKTICQALKISGTSQTNVTSSTNQGIFVNSNCTDDPTSPQNALYGGSGSMNAPSVSVVGGVYGANIFLPAIVQTGVEQATVNYPWPVITPAICGDTAFVEPGHPDTLNPGVFPGSNNAWKTKSFPPNGIKYLKAGLYCLDNDFKATGGDEITGIGITIFQRSGVISIQGGAINLAAPYSGEYKGLLFYMPFSNTGGYIVINGNGSSTYYGSIIAPGTNVTLNGGGDTTGPFRTQVVADTITIGGNGTLNIYYDAENQYQPLISADVQLVR